MAGSTSHLIGRLDAGYLERTPSAGFHWLYRCPGAVEGNKTLARCESDEVNQNTGQPIPEPLIETRREGGYTIIAPSKGKVHPTGEAYVLISGGLESVPVITPRRARGTLRSRENVR